MNQAYPWYLLFSLISDLMLGRYQEEKKIVIDTLARRGNWSSPAWYLLESLGLVTIETRTIYCNIFSNWVIIRPTSKLAEAWEKAHEKEEYISKSVKTIPLEFEPWEEEEEEMWQTIWVDANGYSRNYYTLE